MDDFTSVQVIVSPALPLHPSPGEDARRIVRHGMADVLAWLGEAVGPEPGAATHAMYGADFAPGGGAVVMVSASFAEQLRAKAGGR